MSKSDPKVFYTVYLRKDDSIIAAGTAKQCAEQMRLKNVDTFYSLVSKCRTGKQKRYDIITESQSEPRAEAPLIYDKSTVCMHNPYVDCTNRSNCPSCGWDPAVAEARLKSITGG